MSSIWIIGCVQLCAWNLPSSTYIQREGMDQLEYQPMPSLRDVANDGVLCTFSKR